MLIEISHPMRLLLGAQRARKNDKDFMVRMGKSLSRFLKDDYERLASILRRLL